LVELAATTGEGPAPAPVVIGGASGSGTTLLATILNRHSRLLCGPELSCFDKAALYDLDWAACRRLLRRDVQRRFEIEDVRWKRRTFARLNQTGVRRADLAAMAAGAGSFREWLDAFAERYLTIERKARWLEKTPTNVFCARRFLDLYPDGRFIQIVRDGRDCIISQMARGRSLFFSSWIWLCAVSAGYALREHPRCLTLRYEDLVTSPGEAVRAVCLFMGEPFEAGMLEPGASANRRTHTSWRSRPAEAINTRSVGKYRSVMDRATEELFFSFALTPKGQARYGTPFSGVPDALEAWGYEATRASWPDATTMTYQVQRARHGPLQRLLHWIKDNPVPDHMPQDLIAWRGW
jgi:hypothetical protein